MRSDSWKEDGGLLFLSSLWVFFVSLPKKRPWWTLVRLVIRGRPAPFWTQATATLTGSRLVHVCVGTDSVVLEPSWTGDKFWPFVPFVYKFPSLTWAVLIPTNNAPQFKQVPRRSRRSAWPTLARFATLGLTNADDCVTSTTGVLASAGVTVPRTVVSPKQLLAWLRSQGFEQFDLSPPDLGFVAQRDQADALGRDGVLLPSAAPAARATQRLA